MLTTCTLQGTSARKKLTSTVDYPAMQIFGRTPGYRQRALPCLALPYRAVPWPYRLSTMSLIKAGPW